MKAGSSGDWDEHPSDTEHHATGVTDINEEYLAIQKRINRMVADQTVVRAGGIPWNLIPGARPFDSGHGHVKEVLAQAREAELRAEERFKAIPGGLDIGRPGAYLADTWHECGCVTDEDTAAEKRCLDHYRDALYYRNRIKAMRHATLAGLEWPVPKHRNSA